MLPTTFAPVRSSCGRHPVRIAYVIDNLSRAGTESQLLALVRSLDRTRFEPSLVLLDGTSRESRNLEPTDCAVHRLGITRLVGARAASGAWRLQRLWRTCRPDIVQAYFLDSSYLAVPIARWLGVPRIVRVRNNLGYWLTRRHRLMNRLIRRWVDVSLTNSEAGRERLIHQDGLNPEQVTTIGNGVDLDRFATLEPPRFESSIRIGCVANLRPVKNVDGLMRAAKRVLARYPDATFHVAGDGDQRTALERLRSELGLESRFELSGSIADVPAFLGRLDIAVLPSHSEGMSNALLEYMAAGRAIVATDTGANARLVRSGREGVIVPVGDEAALAAAIESLIDAPTWAGELAAAAQVRAESEFGREAMVRRFEEFYLRLVDGRSHEERRVFRPMMEGFAAGVR